MAVVAGERTPGEGDQPDAAKVLTHPAFDRPPVPNERRRGRKAGAVSLAIARRRKLAKAPQAEVEAPTLEPCPMRPPDGTFVEVLTDSPPEPSHRVDGQERHDARGLSAPDRAVVDAALTILGQHMRAPGALFDSVAATRSFVRLHLAGWDRERFAVLFLDGQHRLIEFEVMFEGTLTQTSVYPREVARRALHWNAGAVILAHNHPSGTAEPSKADHFLTRTLRDALLLVDVRVLDHLVIGWPDVVSFAERGLM